MSCTIDTFSNFVFFNEKKLNNYLKRVFIIKLNATMLEGSSITQFKGNLINTNNNCASVNCLFCNGGKTFLYIETNPIVDEIRKIPFKIICQRAGLLPEQTNYLINLKENQLLMNIGFVSPNDKYIINTSFYYEKDLISFLKMIHMPPINIKEPNLLTLNNVLNTVSSTQESNIVNFINSLNSIKNYEQQIKEENFNKLTSTIKSYQFDNIKTYSAVDSLKPDIKNYTIDEILDVFRKHSVQNQIPENHNFIMINETEKMMNSPPKAETKRILPEILDTIEKIKLNITRKTDPYLNEINNAIYGNYGSTLNKNSAEYFKAAEVYCLENELLNEENFTSSYFADYESPNVIKTKSEFMSSIFSPDKDGKRPVNDQDSKNKFLSAKVINCCAQSLSQINAKFSFNSISSSLLDKNKIKNTSIISTSIYNSSNSNTVSVKPTVLNQSANQIIGVKLPFVAMTNPYHPYHAYTQQLFPSSGVQFLTPIQQPAFHATTQHDVNIFMHHSPTFYNNSYNSMFVTNTVVKQHGTSYPVYQNMASPTNGNCNTFKTINSNSQTQVNYAKYSEDNAKLNMKQNKTDNLCDK